MISDIISQMVCDLDRYLSDSECADMYVGELRSRIVLLRDEADAIRTLLDRDLPEAENQKNGTPTLADRMMSEETTFDLQTPRFSKKDLKQRGWSDSLIDELLGPPDWTEPNPHIPTAARMRCWRQERVAAAEQTHGFLDRVVRRRSRSAVKGHGKSSP